MGVEKKNVFIMKPEKIPEQFDMMETIRFEISKLASETLINTRIRGLTQIRVVFFKFKILQ
ncbi:hypothetical protein [Alkalibacter mobilis]|uniref:hypothetical protein n=1 Tax=Alkalibacter mobilis TaxID=2787712 RepID=UPI00189EDD23|nr:hypothetical protein [Alkalibacter mobilis]